MSETRQGLAQRSRTNMKIQFQPARPPTPSILLIPKASMPENAPAKDAAQ